MDSNTVDSNTVLILSFSGGSTKGYGENRVMQKIVRQLGMSQKDFFKQVTAMAGVSTGAILSCAYGSDKTFEEIDKFYLEKAKRIFTVTNTDSDRPGTLSKIYQISQDNAFYASPSPSSNYGSNILHQTLVENFDVNTLANLNIPVVIPAVEQDMSRPVIFSNFNDSKFFTGKDFKIVDVCRASSAAFPYLPSYKFNNHDYIDGAFLINNAVDRAIQLGLTIKPAAKRIIVMNISAGIGRNGFDGSEQLGGSDSAAARIFAYSTLLMANAEQYCHRNLMYQAERLGNRYGIPFFYYGWYPTFPPTFKNEIDNSTPEWYTELANMIDTHYAEESGKIADIIGRLTA